MSRTYAFHLRESKPVIELDADGIQFDLFCGGDSFCEEFLLQLLQGFESATRLLTSCRYGRILLDLWTVASKGSVNGKTRPDAEIP